MQTFVAMSIDWGSVLPFRLHDCDGHGMHLKHLGIKISTLKTFITSGWYRYTFLNERLGMFSKAARSRAQANGKVSLNHCKIRLLKVKRQSYIIREVRGQSQGAGRGQGTYLSCRLSISGHMLACFLQTVSKILPKTINDSLNLPGGPQHLSTASNRFVLGKQAPLVTKNTIANDSHTFHFRQCS